MQIGTPLVHLKNEDASGKFHIHVVTWFDYTKFKASGYATLNKIPTTGVFGVTLFVDEDTSVPNMKLLTPVVHTLTLDDITLTTSNPFVEVTVVNLADSSQVGKQKTHKDGADTSSMPDPGGRGTGQAV